MVAAVRLKSMLRFVIFNHRFVIFYHRFVIFYHRFVIFFTLTQFHGRIFAFVVGLGPGRGQPGDVYTLTILTVACTFANSNAGQRRERHQTAGVSFVFHLPVR